MRAPVHLDPVSSSRLEIGRVFAGDFRVTRLIAEGGMGTVYEVEQLSTHKRRALKLLRAPLSAPDKAAQRFEREATVGASIDSEHAVEVIAAGVEDGVQPWLAMELLVGGDLGAVVEHQGRLTPAQLLELFRQLCHGLGAAHAAGIVHRDLKPANIFVARPKRAGMPFMVKILDFGIAKVVEGSRSGATQTETVGSPMWMAPEQLDARRPSPRTDVWALGLIAFWALTGKYFWHAAHKTEANVQAMFVEQLFKPIDAASVRAEAYGVADALPPGFDAWFARCTVREEAARFAGAHEAFEALCLALGEVDPEASSSECSALLPDVELAPSTSAPVVAPEHTLPSGLQTGNAPLGFAPTEAHTGAYGADASQAVPPPAAAPAAAPAPYPVVVLAVLLAALTAAGGVAIWLLVGDDDGVAVGDDGGTEVLAQRDSPTSEPDPETLPTLGGRVASPQGGKDDPADTDIPEPKPDPVPSTTTTSVDDEPDPALELVVPLRTQLGHIAREIDFRGWTADGTRFVLAVTRADIQNERAKSRRLRMIEVHDTLTGDMIESYVLSHDAGPRARPPRGKRARALEEAGDADAWKARSKTLELVGTEPRRTLGEGAPLLSVILEDAPGTTKTRLGDTDRGWSFRWHEMPPIGSEDGIGPRLVVSAQADGAAWPVIATRVPFSTADVAARRPDVAPGAAMQPAVVGRIHVHWSPDGSRMLVIVASRIVPSEDPEPARESRYYLRGAGPQIRIVEAGAGQAAARKAVVTLTNAGLHGGRIALREPPVAQSTVHARRGHDGADALAKEIAGVLSLPEGGEIGKGWSSVVVVLGHDAGR